MASVQGDSSQEKDCFSLLKCPCPLTKALFILVLLLSNMQTSQRWDWPVVLLHSTEWFDCFY